MGQRVAVVGAGVAGLAVAYELTERGERLGSPLEVSCLEAGPRAGGAIRTERAQGFCCEWAANGFLDDAPATVTLVRRLGLEPRLVPSDRAAAERWVWRAGKLRRLPRSPARLLGSDVLPLGARLRLLAEPLVRRARREEEESVAGFVARRFGRGAARVLADAMVSGVFAGDAARLSVDSAFPELAAMEREHGSLFRGLLAGRRPARAGEGGGDEPVPARGRLTSLRDGMQELTDALAAALGPRLRLRSPIERVSDLGSRGMRLHPAEGAPFDVDAVVLALPAGPAAGLVAETSPVMAEALQAIPSAAVAVVHLGFRRGALGDLPGGFGYLVPRGEGVRGLGTLFASNIFPGRAPEGSLLMTVMLGGAHDGQALELTDAHLLELATADLARVLGIHARPYFTKVLRQPAGIPQYTLGHAARLEAIERERASIPGLWLAGSSYHGVSVNACIARAPAVAESVLEHLAGRTAAGNHSALS